MSIHLDQANVIVPVVDEGSFQTVSTSPAADAPWDCIELRLDLYQAAPAALPLPVLLTPRHPDEGGAADNSDPTRRGDLCRPWIGDASAIDVEIARAAEMHDLLDETRAAGLATVLSFHDFDATPELSVLEEKVMAAGGHGADVTKIATHTDTEDDVARLLSLFDRFPDQKLALMGMGPMGKTSRLEAAKRGSVLNYSAIDTPTVEGQWQADELRERLVAEGVR